MTNRIRLVGAHEIREMLAPISRQRLYQLALRPDFPQPAATPTQGKVWFTDEIEAWAAAHLARRRKHVHPDTPRPRQPHPKSDHETPRTADQNID
jgi:prophage regulatory protein